uniref:Uncharacterized protein n=1 Tax=Ciona savignyi TaxID=51511 RepID=H2Z0B0_CIOSA
MRVAKSSPKIRPDMRRRFSKSTSIATGPLPRLREHKCPARATLDGRIAVQLEDPPNASVINPTREKKQALELLTSYAIAGPAVRIRLADKDAIKSGAVLQIGLSVSLQRAKWFGSNQELKKQSGISCLQSDSSSGPFHETVNCYYYGNTLQATLDTSTLRNSENGCQIYAVPVVKVDDGYLGAPFPWSCIGQNNISCRDIWTEANLLEQAHAACRCLALVSLHRLSKYGTEGISRYDYGVPTRCMYTKHKVFVWDLKSVVLPR